MCLVCIYEFGELIDGECEQKKDDKNYPLFEDADDTCDISLPIAAPII